MTRRPAAAALLLAMLAAAPVVARQDAPDLGSPALRIAWDEFKPLYDEGRVVVVDVRDADAFAAGHIPGARSVPAAAVESAVDDLRRLGRPVVTYCACPSEHSSADVALTLRRRGIDARALVGGWVKWFEETGGRAERGRPASRR